MRVSQKSNANSLLTQKSMGRLFANRKYGKPRKVHVAMIYNPKGVCSREIQLEVEDGVVKEVKFIGGCAGNTVGISRLIAGVRVDDAIRKLEGIKCGAKGTSCPDQLAQALKSTLR